LDLGAPFLLREGRLLPLESRRAMSANRAAPFRGREILEISGAASPVRFKNGDQLEFVMRALLPVGGHQRLRLMKDPMKFELYRLDPNRGRNTRELILTQRGFINSNGSTGVFLYVRSHGQYSFLLRPGEPLPPGEYALKFGLEASDAQELHCFGVDQ
jgi:hypothetical protein